MGSNGAESDGSLSFIQIVENKKNEKKKDRQHHDSASIFNRGKKALVFVASNANGLKKGATNALYTTAARVNNMNLKVNHKISKQYKLIGEKSFDTKMGKPADVLKKEYGKDYMNRLVEIRQEHVNNAVRLGEKFNGKALVAATALASTTGIGTLGYSYWSNASIDQYTEIIMDDSVRWCKSMSKYRCGVLYN